MMAHAGGAWDRASVKEQFAAMQALWSEEDLVSLVERLKEMTLNFSLDRVKFAKFLQLSTTYDSLAAQWFDEFSHDRASLVVDGLEFLSAAILLSAKIKMFRKVCLLFLLFDLDKSGIVRKDEFTIFLKAISTGLYRTVDGLPPPASIQELGSLSAEFFGSLNQPELQQKDLLMWITEAHYSLHYMSVLSRLGTAVFSWGTNHRRQLGMNFEPEAQRVPAPMLCLEGVRVASVATNESHTLLLTEEGQVWSCGAGFCGILGHGDLSGAAQPRIVEALAHTRIVDVAVGVRHSVAVSEKGQVFTWGAADMGQLGHGSTEDREVHTWDVDPKSGSGFAYVTRPTVVMELFGKRIRAVTASCCNFSTAVLTEKGDVYTWGNNTDGQCGLGQRCPDHKLIYVDPHMQRTAMQTIMSPRKMEAEGGTTFHEITCGGYHMLAIDKDSRLWTWGQGLWGKLGHGDQRTMYEAKMVDSLKYQLCASVAGGEAHSMCLLSLCRLTVTGGPEDEPLSPFSLLGLPISRVDLHAAARQKLTPPGTSLHLDAFASARVLQVRLPLSYDPAAPLADVARHPIQEIQDSIVLMDRGLWEGEWLKLATTDFDFRISMSPAGAPLSAKAGLSAPLMFATEGKFDPDTDCADKVCVVELVPKQGMSAPQDLAPLILDLARKCQKGRGVAFLAILPKRTDPFLVEEPSATSLTSFPFGVIGYDHGSQLKKHAQRLMNNRIGEATNKIPEEAKGWRECREEYTGKVFYEHSVTGNKRWAPPMIYPQTEASLAIVREDLSMQRILAIMELQPKGIIVSQQSWRPDVELVALPEGVLERASVPVVTVSYEAGEELKRLEASAPWVTMEVQPYGGVCAFGSGTSGQLGLSGIENRDFLTRSQNALTGEVNSFATQPFYVAHLHEHLVTNIACGAKHTVAVTQMGEVFAWGNADGLGVPLDKSMSEVPVYVEQLEGLVKAKRAYAGFNHSFVVADMPYKSIV
jgi:alpha-tubulin suppressor-like RCC1 family protein